MRSPASHRAQRIEQHLSQGIAFKIGLRRKHIARVAHACAHRALRAVAGSNKCKGCPHPHIDEWPRRSASRAPGFAALPAVHRGLCAAMSVGGACRCCERCRVGGRPIDHASEASSRRSRGVAEPSNAPSPISPDSPERTQAVCRSSSSPSRASAAPSQ